MTSGSDSGEIIRLFATVPRGLEFLATEEIEEVIGGCGALKRIEQFTGKAIITFSVSEEGFRRSFFLRSIDNLFAMVTERIGVIPEGKGDRGLGLQIAEETGRTCDLDPALSLWRRVIGPTLQTPTEIDSPRFRVTGVRDGTHSFQSPDLAAHFGTGVHQKRPSWKVDLTHWVLEILVKVCDGSLWAGVSLTRRVRLSTEVTGDVSYGAEVDLFKRNRFALVPTTLKASIAYCMLRLARLRCADVVVDPMCGSGTISVECCQVWPTTVAISGDIDPEAVSASGVNSRAAKISSGPPTVVRWSATRLPLRPGCVDLVCTDMPYGRRCGTRAENKRSYSAVLSEISRILRPGGTALILTFMHSLMLNVVSRQRGASRMILVGTYVCENSGLGVTLFVLVRDVE